MIFGIDAWSANAPVKTGVEWYAHHVIEHMKARPLLAGEEVFLYSPKPLEGMLELCPEHWHPKVLRWPVLRGWMPVRMSSELLRRAPDVLFVPSQALPSFAKRSVTTVHDLGPLRFSKLYDAATRRRVMAATRRAVKTADKIFCVSKFTAQELKHFFHVSDDRIVIAANAADTSVYRRLAPEIVESVLRKYRLGKHFFAVLGRNAPNKNIALAVRAFQTFKSTRGVGDPFELVLVGPDGFAAENVRTLGYLPSDETAAILNAATALLSPSLYEGFGVPNLEAMACGAPVIASDIPAYREVCADAAWFVDPNDPNAWVHAMHELAGNAVLCEEYRQKGFARTAAYSWDATAGIILETMRSLIS